MQHAVVSLADQLCELPVQLAPAPPPLQQRPSQVQLRVQHRLLLLKSLLHIAEQALLLAPHHTTALMPHGYAPHRLHDGLQFLPEHLQLVQVRCFFGLQLLQGLLVFLNVLVAEVLELRQLSLQLVLCGLLLSLRLIVIFVLFLVPLVKLLKLVAKDILDPTTPFCRNLRLCYEVRQKLDGHLRPEFLGCCAVVQKLPRRERL
mmetsp:Transcript_21299/g.59080  ORF Transcript_21299/g.59080 Transcript_21299/m.59080 type:complete len:203 (-) Transcript_21299:215-823(-)